MTESTSDPRVYFAAERTLLAWVRTGLTVIGLGFVVARFGLVLRIIVRTSAEQSAASITSTLIGVGLVLVGTISMAVAAWQHARFVRLLEAKDKPIHYSILWPIWFAVSLSIIGLALAIYLVTGSSPAGSLQPASFRIENAT